MQIAPGFDSSDWAVLRLDEASSPDWYRAIDILDSRIRGRFIDPVDCLLAAEMGKPAAERRFGFAILAIDCLLVETLGAFVEGLEDTKDKSEDTFCRFLSTRPLFAKSFTPQLAKQFYREYRCGILHQAEVGGSSRVWSVGELVRADGGALTVNRTRFHDVLKEELTNYVHELQDPAAVDLRTKFRRKMDFICRSGTTRNT